MTTFKTEQEEFWAGAFGNQYISRNESDELLASNLNYFSKALQRAGKIKDCLEFGANIGMNMRALKLLYPSIELNAIEINSNAVQELGKVVDPQHIFEGSIFDFNQSKQVQLSFIKGVLIHINPEMLPIVYEKLYNASSQYILIGEYYNPSPVSISYRGHEDRLFKRDFAGEILDKYSDLRLIDYGFAYKRDPAFPQDDITWFLLEKEKK